MSQQPWEEGYEDAPHVTCLETAPERLNWLQHSWVELVPLLRSVYRVHVLASSSLLQKCPSSFVCEGYKEGLEERAGPRASRFLLEKGVGKGEVSHSGLQAAVLSLGVMGHWLMRGPVALLLCHD